MSVQISVSEEFKGLVDQVMKKKEFEKVSDACEYIGQIFVSRWKAVNRYAAKQKGEHRPAKKAAKKVAKKAAKKTRAPRTPKAPAGNAEVAAAV